MDFEVFREPLVAALGRSVRPSAYTSCPGFTEALVRDLAKQLSDFCEIRTGRRNSLFAGNEGGAHRWAVLASLLQTAKLNGLDPYTWLNDVLARMVSGEVLNNDLDQLLAWNWRPAESTAMRLAA